MLGYFGDKDIPCKWVDVDDINGLHCAILCETACLPDPTACGDLPMHLIRLDALHSDSKLVEKAIRLSLMCVTSREFALALPIHTGTLIHAHKLTHP